MLRTGRLVIVVLFLWCWLQAVIRKVMNGPAACYRRPFLWCMRRRLARREPVTMAAKSTSMHGFPGAICCATAILAGRAHACTDDRLYLLGFDFECCVDWGLCAEVSGTEQRRTADDGGPKGSGCTCGFPVSRGDNG